MYQRYLETSIYTYVGIYKEFILSLPDDIPSIGMLVCDQITHPSMYFTEPSSYLEDTYFGKFASYPKHRFKNEDELYITAVSMIAGILRLDETGFTKNRDVTKRITVSCRQASVLITNPHFKWGFEERPQGLCYCSPERRVSQAYITCCR